jgi:hypothetical protein
VSIKNVFPEMESVMYSYKCMPTTLSWKTRRRPVHFPRDK